MEKKELKKQLLKILKGDMKELMNSEKSELFSDLLPKEKMQKITIMADSPEGLKKGLSKAEQIMEMKLGGKLEESEEQESDEEYEKDESEEESEEEYEDGGIEKLKKKYKKATY